MTVKELIEELNRYDDSFPVGAGVIDHQDEIKQTFVIESLAESMDENKVFIFIVAQ